MKRLAEKERIVDLAKNLSAPSTKAIDPVVERAFREIKSFLEIRPMNLSREDHVCGHVAMCFLAFYLETALLKILRSAEEEKKQTTLPGKNKRETLSAHPLDSILTSLKKERMVELAAAGSVTELSPIPTSSPLPSSAFLGCPLPDALRKSKNLRNPKMLHRHNRQFFSSKGRL